MSTFQYIILDPNKNPSQKLTSLPTPTLEGLHLWSRVACAISTSDMSLDSTLHIPRGQDGKFSTCNDCSEWKAAKGFIDTDSGCWWRVF